MDYTAAKQYCVGQGQTLASIHTPLEQQKAYDACKAVVGDMPAGKRHASKMIATQDLQLV